MIRDLVRQLLNETCPVKREAIAAKIDRALDRLDLT